MILTDIAEKYAAVSASGIQKDETTVSAPYPESFRDGNGIRIGDQVSFHQKENVRFSVCSVPSSPGEPIVV